MNKQSFNWILRVWIGLASLGAMVGGWVAFSHAPKPGADTSASAEGEFAPIPTLSPLPNVQSLPRQQAQTQKIQPQTQPAPQFSQPRLRTRGS